MLYGFLALLGRFLAAMPEAVPSAIARGTGWLIYHCLGRRTRVLHANLHHAFPERPEAWRRRIGLESCRRMVEMALFVLASPYFSEARIRRMFRADVTLSQGPSRVDEPGVAGLILVPHFSLMEALTLIRVIYPELSKELDVGVFYRPFGNASLERWVKATRERFGLRLLSRKAGYSEAAHILKRNGRVGVLFDQHAGPPGALSLFMGRLVSTSELAGVLAEKHNAKAIAFYTERTGFWRGIVKSELVSTTPLAESVTIAANIWLEKTMRADENLCADWLWLHKRWKVNILAEERFRIQQRRDILAENIAAWGLRACPRRERFWIRLPDGVGAMVRAVPLIRALREARPDAEVSLIAAASLAPLLARLGIAEKIITLPERGWGYWRFFRQLRKEFPDTHIVLAESRRADVEAWLAGAPQRFCLRRRGRRRPLLTHRWRLPGGIDETRLHETRLWERWWQAHGLQVPLNLSPLRLPDAPPTAPVVGLWNGTGHMAGLSWPAEYWRTLAMQLLAAHPVKLRLLGPGWGQAQRQAIIEAAPEDGVEDWTEKTDWLELAHALAECVCVVGEDTAGLHLANLQGVPVIGIFGPTNPLRTGPIFDAPNVILQPENCPPTGGVSSQGVTPERVLQACGVFLR